MLKLLVIFVAAMTLSSVALALPPVLKFECRIAKVVDGGAFENINDFSFKDYPHVAYDGNSDSIEGKALLVGALKFTEKDEDQPSIITEESEYRKSIIIAEPEDSGQIFSIEVDDTGYGLLHYADETRFPSAVAELICN